MNDQNIPTMLRMLFGERAALARDGASPRLLRWCTAFDEWLDDRRCKHHAATYKGSITAWKRMLGEMGKAPWEISQADVKGYTAWMQEQRLAPSTIKYELSTISSFYNWCRQRQIDDQNWEGVNPTEGVPRPRIRHYANAKVLNGEEARALLAVLKLDEAILTKRDYAFFLARLRLGVPLKKLQQLQWGQIERDETGTWVTWRGESERSSLPGDVYQSILDYLRAAGRLEKMRAQAYIFPPLIDPLQQEASGKADEWDEKRYLGSTQISKTLKRYGREAGIAEEKLTLPALRHTAVMLRVEGGDSLEDIQAFTQCPQLAVTKNYLKALPPPALQNGELRDLEKDPPRLPERTHYVFRPGKGITHGLYAKSQPPEEVEAVLAEGIRGIEEEIAGLRILNRGLMEMQNRATTTAEVASLADAYTRSSARLAEMIKAEEEIKKRGEGDRWTEDMLGVLARTEKTVTGREVEVEEVRREIEMELDGGEMLAVNARRLAEEIAGVRATLRRTFHLAIESETAQELVRMTDVYGKGCSRLVKLLRREGDDNDRVKIYLEDMFNQVIIEFIKEMGLDEE